MALIRGLKSLYPCPRCFVPSTELSKIITSYQPRTQADAHEAYTAALQAATKAAGELIMKEKSLRLVKVGCVDLS